MPRPESTLSRVLEPIASALGILFFLLSVFVALVWGLNIGEAQLNLWVQNRDLFRAAAWLLERLDIIWIVLGAAHVYLCFAGQDGLATARVWAILIVGAVFAVAWVSVRTGTPLGPIEFGTQLGVKIGPVPIGLPLFWLAVILSAREAILRFRPKWGQGKTALAVAALGALTDFSLEPLATGARGFWFWRPETLGAPPVFAGPWWLPLQWGLLAGLLAFILHERDVIAAVRQRIGKSAAPFFVFHLVFLAGHLGRLIRSW